MFLVCLVVLCVAYGERPSVSTIAVNDFLLRAWKEAVVD